MGKTVFDILFIRTNPTETSDANFNILVRDTVNSQVKRLKVGEGLLINSDGSLSVNPSIASFVWRGTWSGVTSYEINDVVYREGTSYICTQAHINQQPPNITYWDIFVEKGDVGDIGPRGINWTGVYNPLTPYIEYDAFSYNGSSYITILANTGQDPEDLTYFEPIALKGTDGVDGEDSTVPGPPGQSQYIHTAYADDELGTGFTSSFDPSKDYKAVLVTTSPTFPDALDFTGFWVRYKGDGDRWATSSTSSITIGTGTKNFIVDQDLAYTSGQNVIIAETGTPSNRMEGRVISYNPSTGELSVDVTDSNGVGTISDWQINVQGATGSSLYYTGASPSNITVGGLTSGTDLTGKTLSEILESILVAYLVPTFSAFGMSGQPISVEVGTTVSGSKTFTWTTTNSGNVQTNSIVIRDETTTTDLVTGLTNDGSEVVAITSVTRTSPGSHVWRIRGTNTNGSTFTRDFTVSWSWRRYHGTSVNTSLTEAQIEALVSSSLATTFSGNLSFAAGGYKYICFPDSFGSPTAGTGFKDTSTNLAVDMATSADDAFFSNVQNGWYYGIVSVTNSLGVTTNYRVYRSKNILGGTITIQVG